MTVLVTGAAGFIGFHTSQALLAQGETVIGIDSLNDYYDVNLKKARLVQLQRNSGFSFQLLDISNRNAMESFFADHPDIHKIVHLAAQPGVRYSITNPHAYIESNIVGHLNILEGCRHLPRLEHLVYASSSSVYGSNSKLPFSTDDRVATPISLYAATKRADELMSYTYSHLYKLPMTGLRFFTVYGPWGRPDMATYLFTKAIVDGKPIKVFNHGDMKRDFTYIEDIVQGVLAALYLPPIPSDEMPVPHRIYNLGNHRSEPLMRFIQVLEKALGKKAVVDLQPLQDGDIVETYADVDATIRDLGFMPKVSIDEGLPRFVEWFTSYHR